jgi:hypothetical protein
MAHQPVYLIYSFMEYLFKIQNKTCESDFVVTFTLLYMEWSNNPLKFEMGEGNHLQILPSRFIMNE